MERILTSAQMRQADEFTIENLGISSEILVERAGAAVAEEIIKRFKGGRVLVCTGSGNNGADGRVVARILAQTHGFNVVLLDITHGIFKMLDNKYDIIVDCIFGTGLNREITGKYKQAIEKINSNGAFIVSCDIASGLSADTGYALGVAVKANLTIAVQEYKLGHFFNDGFDYSGETVSRDIGISLWGDDYVYRLTDGEAGAFFEKRRRNSNKGSFGKAAVIGGSKRFIGSALLGEYALSALKSGAGYSTLVIPESLFSVYALKNPECILSTFKDENGEMLFDADALDKTLNCNGIAVGMGLGVSVEVYKSVDYLLKNYKGVLIIDADALNSLAAFGKEILKEKTCRVVITPHVKEFSRLCGKEVKEILSDSITPAREFAREYGVTVLLKNSASVITDGKEVCINTTGCSGMAKAGSGDVLSGFAAGLAARGLSAFDCAKIAAFVCGRAGEIAEKESTAYTMTASDIIAALPKAVVSLQ